jgi:signal recognition particle subunit SEC65
MTGTESGPAVRADDDQAPDYYKTLDVQVSAEALDKWVPAWAHPGRPSTRHDNRLMDGHYIATGLLFVAYGAHTSAQSWEVGEWLRRATAARVMEHGQSVRLPSRKLAAYVGAPLLAGRLSAEAVRRACREHSPDDEALHEAVDEVIGLLWPTRAESRPPSRGRGVFKGLALLRHAERWGYREVHPGLELLGMAAAKDDHTYPRVLRKLNHTVAEHHMRGRGRREALYEALLHLLLAKDRPAGARL